MKIYENIILILPIEVKCILFIPGNHVFKPIFPEGLTQAKRKKASVNIFFDKLIKLPLRAIK